MSNSIPYDSSGDNVFKFLVILSIGVLVLNIFYPREKSLEIKQKKSDLEYSLDLLSIKIKPAQDAEVKLQKLKNELDSIKEINGSYPNNKFIIYDSLFIQFDDQITQINEIQAEINHKNRLIKNLDENLSYFKKLSFWTFWPFIFILLLSLIIWIKFYSKNN